MHLRKLGIGLIAVLAFAAIAATSASAKPPTTTAAQWYVGASPGTTLAGSKTIQLEAVGTSKLVSKVGASLTPIELTSTEGECVGCTIENKEITSKAGKVAFGTGKILFKNVVVTTPAHCKAVSEAGVSGQVLTKSLNVHADLMAGERAIQQFIPAAGATASFSALHLENNGGTCAAAGLYSVTGNLYTEAPSQPTGTFSETHLAKITPALEAELGEAATEFLPGGLFIGSQKAELTAEANFFLSPKEEFAIK